MTTKEDQHQGHTETLRQTLRNNPELAKAFRETLDELSKPEKVKEVADGILPVLLVFNKIRQGGNRNEIK